MNPLERVNGNSESTPKSRQTNWEGFLLVPQSIRDRQETNPNYHGFSFQGLVQQNNKDSSFQITCKMLGNYAVPGIASFEPQFCSLYFLAGSPRKSGETKRAKEKQRRVFQQMPHRLSLEDPGREVWCEHGEASGG